jgi:hypothetical protein
MYKIVAFFAGSTSIYLMVNQKAHLTWQSIISNLQPYYSLSATTLIEKIGSLIALKF